MRNERGKIYTEMRNYFRFRFVDQTFERDFRCSALLVSSAVVPNAYTNNVNKQLFFESIQCVYLLLIFSFFLFFLLSVFIPFRICIFVSEWHTFQSASVRVRLVSSCGLFGK